jgi:class 3 adenylate cyclase
MADLPVGSVTFLFTDIEGSTRLWELYPQAMPGVLARHDAILRQAIAAHGGRIFRTGGDGFCAAFAHPPDALAGALAAQVALLAEPWAASGLPTGAHLRVRMALHTGTAEVRDGDYLGPALNRVARLLAAGHGGQILLSSTTAGLVHGALPPGAALHELGEYRLRDLTRPERIFQLVAPGLLADFPPLRMHDPQHVEPVARPSDFALRQAKLPGMPGIDYERVLEKERERERQRRARKKNTPESGGMF